MKKMTYVTLGALLIGGLALPGLSEATKCSDVHTKWDRLRHASGKAHADYLSSPKTVQSGKLRASRYTLYQSALKAFQKADEELHAACSPAEYENYAPKDQSVD